MIKKADMRIDGEVSVRAIGYDEDNRQQVDTLLHRVAELGAEVQQLVEAAQARQQIGLITGVLTQQFGLSPEQAWLLLRWISSQANVKVRDVARLIEAGLFDRLADEDRALAKRPNRHLPSRLRLELPAPRETRLAVPGPRRLGAPAVESSVLGEWFAEDNSRSSVPRRVARTAL